jgi:hypothetical protein
MDYPLAGRWVDLATGDPNMVRQAARVALCLLLRLETLKPNEPPRYLTLAEAKQLTEEDFNQPDDWLRAALRK